MILFDPDEYKEYEYHSNYLSLDNDIDEIDEDEKVSDKLKRYQKTIQTSLYNVYQKFWD